MERVETFFVLYGRVRFPEEVPGAIDEGAASVVEETLAYWRSVLCCVVWG